MSTVCNNFIGRLLPKAEESSAKRRDAEITGYALVAISMVCLVVAAVLMGLSTLPPEVTLGFSMFYTLGSVTIASLGALILLGGLAHFAAAGVYACVKS